MGWQVVYVPFLFAGDTIIDTFGLFVYSSTPGPGNLIASIAPQAGTDPYGNVFQQGMTEYLTISGKTFAVGLNTLSGTGLPGLSLQDITNLPTSPAGFFGESSSNVSTPQAFAAITSGQATAADVATFISVLSQLQSSVVGGQIVLQAGDIQHDINGNLIDYVSNSTGSPLVTETTGDQQTYHIGHFAVRNNGVPVTVSSATAANVLSIPLGGTGGAAKGYRVRGFAIYIGNQAAGAPVFSWGASGGLVLSTQQNGWQKFTGGGVSPIIHNNNGALGAVTGPVFAANTTNWLYEWEIYVNINTPGTLTVTAAEGTAGDSFVINQIYAMVEEY
jgi:hypothetical protein